jgi:ubiquinone/menaquinone biosynthesis C-methylase UbiE
MVEPYDMLAAGYDAVMGHVDYESWSAYVHRLLQRHADAEGVEHVVELGGGTGTFALKLHRRGGYRYVLSDASNAMLEQAASKIDEAGAPIRCVQATFTGVTLQRLGLERPVDAVVLVYDGLNYLLDPADVRQFFRRAARLVRPGGLVLFDQSTPANSEDNATGFTDEGAEGDFAYVRESTYDPDTRRHVTTFAVSVDGRSGCERHVQRAYAPGEIRTLLADSPLSVEAAYDGFSTDPVQDRSHRVHWVTRRIGEEA